MRRSGAPNRIRAPSDYRLNIRNAAARTVGGSRSVNVVGRRVTRAGPFNSNRCAGSRAEMHIAGGDGDPRLVIGAND